MPLLLLISSLQSELSHIATLKPQRLTYIVQLIYKLTQGEGVG